MLRTARLKADPARFVGRGDPELPVELREVVFQMTKPAECKPQHRLVPVDGGATALV